MGVMRMSWLVAAVFAAACAITAPARARDDAGMSYINLTDDPTSAPQSEVIALDQVWFEDKPGLQEKLKILADDHDMAAVIKHLNGLGITFERRSTGLDLARVPADLAKSIRDLPKGEPFLLPTNGKITINVVI